MASCAMMRRALIAVCLVVAVVGEQQPIRRRDQRQLFSASGLVFPGPAMNRRRIHEQPAQAQAQVSPNSEQGDDVPYPPQGRPQNRQNRPQQPQQFRNGPPQNFRPTQQYPQQRQPVQVPVYNPERPRPGPAFESRQDQVKPERITPPVPSSFGQARPDDLPVPRAPPRPQPQVDEEEDRAIDSGEEGEQFVPQRPRLQQPQQPQPIRPPVAPEARRPNIESEPRRPQVSAPQPQQSAKRPNYPANYKAPRPQINDIEDSRRPQPQADVEEDGELTEPLEEEEEEVKPDKLQLLLQKTDFSCAEKKDGYYADEVVDCQVFHYCQDRTRHSWLCPEGASFHQVHLICMPINKENICQKSSEFHFVNDYLYKAVEDENGDSTLLYADRYYPEGYEPGLPFDMEKAKKPDSPQYKTFLKGPQPPANRERQPQYGQNRQPVDNRRQDSRVPLPRRPVPLPASNEEEEAPVVPRRPEPNQRPLRPIPARPVEPEEESEEVDY